MRTIPTTKVTTITETTRLGLQCRTSLRSNHLTLIPYPLSLIPTHCPFFPFNKSPSQLYKEGHVGNYLNSSVRGDPVVKEALTVAVAREEQWSRKSSTICEAREVFAEVSEACFIPTPENTYHFAPACRHSIPNLKKQANSIIAQQYLEKIIQQAEESPFQGEFINLMQQEKIDIT